MRPLFRHFLTEQVEAGSPIGSQLVSVQLSATQNACIVIAQNPLSDCRITSRYYCIGMYNGR